MSTVYLTVELHIYLFVDALVSGKLIDKVVSFMHEDDSLAFWIHMNCELEPTHSTG
jgi:hypothetical protein